MSLPIKEKNNKRILFTSISFPPKKDSEALQVAKYFKSLQATADKFKYDVLTSSMPTLNMPYEEQLLSYDKGYENKIELNIPESKYLNFLLRKTLPSVIQKPDSKFWFHLQSRKAIKKILSKPDLIYSRAYPLSSSIMGYKLAEFYDVPWVMHLSDPWTAYSLNNYTKKSIKWHRTWENKCFLRASKICFTSLETIDLYNEIYPEFKEKFEYFPNVYDRDDSNTEPFSWEGKFRMVYTGGLIGERSLKWIIEPLQILIKKHPEFKCKFELIFCGEMDRENKSYIQNLDLPYIVNAGVLSYKESVYLQRTAHLLVLVDNPNHNNYPSVFFPSKLLDYALCQRKILSITPEASTANKITHQLGGSSFSHGQTDLIVAYLKKMVTAFIDQKVSYFCNAVLPEEYSSTYQANRLHSLFVDLLK